MPLLLGGRSLLAVPPASEKPRRPVDTRGASRHPVQARFLAGLLFLIGLLALASTAAEIQPLRFAQQVRQLSVTEADQRLPVRMRGVITFFDQRIPSASFRFVQDETAGIYFYFENPTGETDLRSGQLVEIEGVTARGEFAPVLVAQHVRLLGNHELPRATSVVFEELAGGLEDSQFIELTGIVRSAEQDKASDYYALDLATGGGRLTMLSRTLPVPDPQTVVDSVVRVRGVSVTRFNRRRQFFALRLLIPRTEDFVIEKPAPAAPFDIATTSIASLLQFAPNSAIGHRAKLGGVVVLHQPGRRLFIQEGEAGLQAETLQNTPLRLGDRVEVLGFPAQGDYTPVLRDSVYRATGQAPMVVPVETTPDEVLRGTYDCRLVRLNAKLLDRSRQNREQFLLLESGGFIFQASLDAAGPADGFNRLQNGSLLAVTGVCLIETGERWDPSETWRAKSFQLLLRSAADITVLRAPPWWSLQRLLWTVGILGGSGLAAMIWAAVLRRRVSQQTEIIRRQLDTEATLKERYLDLFENATDMVYTHNLEGRITSINQAGEKLLGRARGDILQRHLIELVLEQQRPAASAWLEQVIQGTAPTTAEWDFATPSGDRVRLEISPRRIEHDDRCLEVEGIARDVTERRRLEKEILEISTREQRRIGHDLHDGICQQLAAISFLSDILADKLEETGRLEAADARKITDLVNKANTQTRSVARGLFPLRLEENGLIAALEELANNATVFFGVKCEFSCDVPLAVSDTTLAHHLYYIAQEAILNAARHARARLIQVRIERRHGRCALIVSDDGVGLSAQLPERPTMGIRIMKYRARTIGADLEMRSVAGAGTSVSCRFQPESGAGEFKAEPPS